MAWAYLLPQTQLTIVPMGAATHAGLVGDVPIRGVFKVFWSGPLQPQTPHVLLGAASVISCKLRPLTGPLWSILSKSLYFHRIVSLAQINPFRRTLNNKSKTQPIIPFPSISSNLLTLVILFQILITTKCYMCKCTHKYTYIVNVLIFKIHLQVNIVINIDT